jgi:hexokinase
VVKHAGNESLDKIETLLERLRRHGELVEKKRGTFYHKSSAFLHFHEDSAGMFADLKLAGEFQRFRVTTQKEQSAFLREVASALAPRAAPSRDTRRGE